jgi:hypothetical protein
MELMGSKIRAKHDKDDKHLDKQSEDNQESSLSPSIKVPLIYCETLIYISIIKIG